MGSNPPTHPGAPETSSTTSGGARSNSRRSPARPDPCPQPAGGKLARSFAALPRIRTPLPGKQMRVGPLELTTEDLLPDIAGQERRFLGILSRDQLWEDLSMSGIVAQLETAGFRDLRLELGETDRCQHEFSVYDKECCRTRLLLELRLRRGVWPPCQTYVPKGDFKGMRVLTVEWLALQNPTIPFTEERPRLPGQDFPGLGVGRRFHKLLEQWARQSGHSALINIPEYYHNAAIYSSDFFFYSPYAEGKLRRMMTDLDQYPLAVTSFAILLDGLREARTGRNAPWLPHWQICPLVDQVATAFASGEYLAKVEKTKRCFNYRLDPAAVSHARRIVYENAPAPD